MAFFKKNVREMNKSLDLPELPGTSKLPELPSLPSLPESKANDSFGIQAIKSNIMGDKNMPEEKRTIELGERIERPQFTSMTPRKMVAQKEPVFVKLDKFKDSVSKFEEIKTKINDIDSTLRKIKEIREKEDHELRAWEEKVQLIKEKVDSIDNSLFSRM
ncbi:MAG: hypothetical protein AABX17_01275 [Nanoarchaeota archaeon]